MKEKSLRIRHKKSPTTYKILGTYRSIAKNSLTLPLTFGLLLRRYFEGLLFDLFKYFSFAFPAMKCNEIESRFAGIGGSVPSWRLLFVKSKYCKSGGKTTIFPSVFSRQISLVTEFGQPVILTIDSLK